MHPGVLECAAVGVPDAKSGEAVKLFVVKKDPALTAADVLKHCREHLTGYKCPRDVEFRDRPAEDQRRQDPAPRAARRAEEGGGVGRRRDRGRPRHDQPLRGAARRPSRRCAWCRCRRTPTTTATSSAAGSWRRSTSPASVPASRRARGRVATVAVNSFVFKEPVLIGDLVSFYATITHVGRTSITVEVEVYAQRNPIEEITVKVTEASLTYVAVGADRRPAGAASRLTGTRRSGRGTARNATSRRVHPTGSTPGDAPLPDRVYSRFLRLRTGKMPLPSPKTPDSDQRSTQSNSRARRRHGAKPATAFHPGDADHEDPVPSHPDCRRGLRRCARARRGAGVRHRLPAEREQRQQHRQRAGRRRRVHRRRDRDVVEPGGAVDVPARRRAPRRCT